MQDLGVRLPIYPTRPVDFAKSRPTGSSTSATTCSPRSRAAASKSTTASTGRRGRHQIQFGGEMAFQDVKIRNEFRRAGHFQFASSTTAGTGHALADFMLGAVSTFDQGTGEYKDYDVFYGSAFFQDDLKVSDRVTLNLGVRFEHSPPWHEVEGPHHALERRGLQRERAFHDVPGSASRRDVPRRRGVRRRRGRRGVAEHRKRRVRIRMGHHR